MKRIASSTAVAVAPTYSADAGTPGHFAESPSPTHLTAKWCEAVQEGHVRTIEDAGTTLSDSMAQFSDTVAGVHAVKSGVTTTGTVTTPRTRVAIASDTCLASAATSATLASSLSTASGAISAVVAAGASTASGAISAVVGAISSTATAAQSVVVGGDSHNATAENSGVFGGYDHDATAARAVCIGGNANNATAIDAATLGGSANTASGAYSATAGGATNTAGGSTAVCLGGGTSTANGQGAATVGAYASTADGAYAGVLACDGGGATGDNSAVIGCDGCATTVNAVSSAIVASQNAKVNTALALAGGYSATTYAAGNSNQNLKWRINSTDGSMVINSTLTQSGDANADFAEMFENAAAGALPPGSLLARTGRKIRLALPGDRIAGVVSAAPMVLAGGTGELGWAKATLTDEWGRVVTEVVTLTRHDGSEYTITVPCIRPDYDATIPNVSRLDRPDEWTAVALVGQVRVRIGDGVVAGDFLGAGADGCAVASVAPVGRLVEVMEIVTEYDAGKGYGVALCLVG